MLYFFFNDTPTTEIYTLSLHDALPICRLLVLVVEAVGEDRRRANERGNDIAAEVVLAVRVHGVFLERALEHVEAEDRKSTRLNSSHSQISYAVFCLKKKKKQKRT